MYLDRKFYKAIICLVFATVSMAFLPLIRYGISEEKNPVLIVCQTGSILNVVVVGNKYVKAQRLRSLSMLGSPCN